MIEAYRKEEFFDDDVRWGEYMLPPEICDSMGPTQRSFEDTLPPGVHFIGEISWEESLEEEIPLLLWLRQKADEWIELASKRKKGDDRVDRGTGVYDPHLSSQASAPRSGMNRRWMPT